MSGGMNSQQSSSNGQQSSAAEGFPYNLQNPAYVGLAPGVAAGLAGIYQSSPWGIQNPGADTTANSNASAAGLSWGTPGGAQGGGGGFTGGTGTGQGFNSGDGSVGSNGWPGGVGAPGAGPGLAGSSGRQQGSTGLPFLGYGQTYPQAYQPPGGPGGNFSPFTVGGQPSNNPNTNPLVAPVTPQQWASLGNIGTATLPSNVGMAPASLMQSLQGFTQPGYTDPGTSGVPQAFNLLRSFMDPNFAAGLATSPQTQAAISSATNPIEQAFRAQTVPQLGGASTAAGQRTNGPGQAGSSAFDAAYGNAAGNEQAAVGQTAGNIANQAYQTGIGINANAPNALVSNTGQLEQQATTAATAPAQLSSMEVQNMISGLSAEVLPQLTQQYGINQGTQLFQTQIQYLLSALGLAGQVSQPAIAYTQQSEGQGTNTSQQTASGFNFGVPGIGGGAGHT